MTNLLRELDERISTELQAIEQTVERTRNAWAGTHRFPDQRDYYLDSVALNLHSFYNGLERIFELIARGLDRSLPQGEQWHRGLLWQMGQELVVENGRFRPGTAWEEVAMDESTAERIGC